MAVPHHRSVGAVKETPQQVVEIEFNQNNLFTSIPQSPLFDVTVNLGPESGVQFHQTPFTPGLYLHP